MNSIKKIITTGANTRMTQKEFLEAEIRKWKKSIKRINMITGEKYYSGEHDILSRQRTAIGKDGELYVVENLPNNKIIDNQYGKMVDQKKNYLLGKLLTFDTENKNYEAALKQIFNRKFHRTLKNLGEDSLNGGIGWLHPYYNEQGELKFKKFESYEVLPFWKDAEHTELDFAVRLYEIEAYEGIKEKTIEKVEIYSVNGIERYVLENGKLILDVENPSSTYMTVENAEGVMEGYNWERIPLIAFKYNAKEIPLITRVKSLQDGINIMLSDFENNMQEDARNTILVIENYDGANLAEFRHNLATYGAVKVKSIDGAKGGVSTLTVEVNADNYKAIVEIFKKALIENARGYDAKDERMSGTPNQMNIQSMYNDIDLDANEMETEYQASFEELLWFINSHLANTGQGDFSNEEVNIIFNRDMMMNETEIMGMLTDAGVEISNETLLGQVPFISDVGKELERLKDQKEEAIDDYANAFNPVKPLSDEEGDDDVQE
jgi:SPP1 family phage portal protein